MRDYTPHSKRYIIEKNRYHELKSFCRQYHTWKSEVANCYGLSGVRFNGVPVRGISNPTANAAERAMALQDKIDLVDRVCKETDEYLCEFIKWNVTRGISYEIMERQGIAPHVSKSVFYEARMRFFWLLDKEKE